MTNLLKKDKQALVIKSLAEGCSIRSTERISGIHRDTIMRLGVRVGNACIDFMDQQMVDLGFDKVEVDEIWGFIGKKQKNVKEGEKYVGDIWTFVAMDPETKVVPCFAIGKRDQDTTDSFMRDLKSRMKNRIQLSSDGLESYVEAVDKSFGLNIDYGKVVKTYKKKPNKLVIKKEMVAGYPDLDEVSTSYIERQNLTMRMHVRRLTRKTNAFSKKLNNFISAIGLHFAYYNFVKTHVTLEMTPAMAANISTDFMTVEDLIDLPISSDTDD